VANRNGRIIESAAELFAERGYQGTSIEAIADRAGVSRSLIFFHFDSKNGLLSAVVAEVCSRWLGAIIAAAAGMVGLDALTEALRTRGRILREEPQVARLVTVLMAEALALAPDLAPTFAGLIEALTEQVSTWVEEATACGQLDLALEAPAVARFIVAALEGATQLWALEPDRYDVAAADATLLAVINVLRAD